MICATTIVQPSWLPQKRRGNNEHQINPLSRVSHARCLCVPNNANYCTNNANHCTTNAIEHERACCINSPRIATILCDSSNNCAFANCATISAPCTHGCANASCPSALKHRASGFGKDHHGIKRFRASHRVNAGSARARWNCYRRFRQSLYFSRRARCIYHTPATASSKSCGRSAASRGASGR